MKVTKKVSVTSSIRSDQNSSDLVALERQTLMSYLHFFYVDPLKVGDYSLVDNVHTLVLSNYLSRDFHIFGGKFRGNSIYPFFQ